MGRPLRAEGFPKRRCQFEFIAAKPHLNPRKGRSSLFVKIRHHTRLGCGEISLAGFPRGSPYETAAGRVFLRPATCEQRPAYYFHRLYAIP